MKTLLKMAQPALMRAWRLRILLIAGFAGAALYVPASGSAFSAEHLFRDGFRAYAAGGFEQAAVLFHQAAGLAPSSGVLHNLGNAEWKCGRVGAAIRAWEQAQWLDPFNANTRANLRFARKAARLDAPELTWYENCSTWLPLDAWGWIAAGSFWLALALVLLPPVFRWRKADWHQALAAAAIAVFLLTVPALVGIDSRSKLGVVLIQDTPLRLTPTSEAQVLARLPAGEIGRIEGKRGQYVYVRTGNDAAGWVELAQFGRICS